VQVPSAEPYIYGKDNLCSPITLNFVPMAMANEAIMHALLAHSGYHRLLLKDKQATLTDYKDKGSTEQGGRQVSYHLFEAFRLMRKCFEDPKYALSNASINAALVLTACTVSGCLSDLRFFLRLSFRGCMMARQHRYLSSSFPSSGTSCG
jgi:hypothetical protein